MENAFQAIHTHASRFTRIDIKLDGNSHLAHLEKDS